MAPNITSAPTGVLHEEDEEIIDTIGNDSKKLPSQVPVKRELKLVWRNIILFVYLHIAAVYGMYLMLTSAKLATIAFAIILYQMGGLGITAGAHRLWAHRAYKANWALRVLLTIFNTIAFQNHVIEWARDHRVHHKYSETDADPHNATRGFFFAHMGWLLCRKHPEVKNKGKGIDVSDLEADPILRFQRKYYLALMPVLCFLLPTTIPVYCWGESWGNAWFVCALFRYAFTLNATWLVNSAAHLWGNKPYDRFINPAENLGVAIAAMGEGWHNYHHTFPWDYKTAELGNYRANFTTAFIDFMSKIGWAYELKTVSNEMIQKRVDRTGDGTHELWGWGDKDQSEQERNEATILRRAKSS